MLVPADVEVMAGIEIAAVSQRTFCLRQHSELEVDELALLVAAGGGAGAYFDERRAGVHELRASESASVQVSSHASLETSSGPSQLTLSASSVASAVRFSSMLASGARMDAASRSLLAIAGWSRLHDSFVFVGARTVLAVVVLWCLFCFFCLLESSALTSAVITL